MFALSAARSSLRTTVVRSTAARACFSTDDAAHRPVIQVHGIHARYANAAYVAASKNGVLDKVESELLGLQKAQETSPQFATLMGNPLISREDKTAYVQKLDKISDVTRNLLVTMAGNARLGDLAKVVETYAQLMKAKRGEIDAKIISAEQLTAAQLKDVQAAMTSQVPKGKSVVIETVVDPSIVGGLQVQIGDQFLDLSVKSRIDEFANMSIA